MIEATIRLQINDQTLPLILEEFAKIAAGDPSKFDALKEIQAILQRGAGAQAGGPQRVDIGR